MFDLDKKFKCDPVLENEGKWFDFGDGARMLIARIGNDKYKKVFAEKTKPYAVQMRTNTLSENIAERLICESMAAAILLDWEDVYEEDKPLPYNYQNAVRVLTRLPEFRKTVYALADDIENFRQAEEADTIKNFASSSTGT